jgi:hypothetical protein
MTRNAMAKNLPTPDSSRWFIPAASLFLFVASCALPCLEIDQEGRVVWYGYRVLLMGWMTLLVGQMAWLANPLWLAGMFFFLFQRWTLSLGCALIGLSLAATSLLFFGWGEVGIPVQVDEGIVAAKRLRVGAYVWLSSLLVLFMGAAHLRRRVHHGQSV